MSIAIQLTDEFVAALLERAHELRLIDGRRRWAELDGVAEYLGVSVRRVRDLRERGLPAKRIGRRLLFDLREVDAWLERQ
jgi:excisionase family DNA binding protein